jgi:RNA polymerase sigma-70 factor (ECF subfamily)
MLDLDCHVSAIAAGDAIAFEHWLAGAEQPLRALLRRFAAHVDIEAVLQEALLRTWQVAPRFQADGRENGLLRLAQRIAKNLAIDLARREQHAAGDTRELLEEVIAAPTPRAPDPFLQRLIAECHAKLPPKPAAALAARIADGGAFADSHLARRLQMATNTFLQNVTRARKLLAECLTKQGVDWRAELT